VERELELQTDHAKSRKTRRAEHRSKARALRTFCMRSAIINEMQRRMTASAEGTKH